MIVHIPPSHPSVFSFQPSYYIARCAIHHRPTASFHNPVPLCSVSEHSSPLQHIRIPLVYVTCPVNGSVDGQKPFYLVT